MQSPKQQNDLFHFQGKPFNITVLQVYAPTSNAEAAEVEWFNEDQQDLLELTAKKDVLFISGEWDANNKLWKILKKMGIPDHLACLLRNLYAGQEATVKTGHGTTDWFQTGKYARLYIVTLVF